MGNPLRGCQFRFALAPAVSQHHFHRRRQGDEKARVNRSAE